MTAAPPWRRALGLLFLSAAALGFEVALVRLYAIQQFYHFAFLVISLAVLGAAGGGTALALVRRPAPPGLLAAGFSASVGLAYAILNGLPFDSYAIAWDRRQVAVLGLYFATAAAPFFFAGWYTGGELADSGPAAGRAYAASLIGSGLGPLAALGIVAIGRLELVVAAAGAAGLLVAALVSVGRLGRTMALIGVAGLAWSTAAYPRSLELTLSPNKPLAQALTYPDARATEFREDLSARLQGVESAGVHSFPGLSLEYDGPLPSQVGLFLDADGPLAVSAIDPDQAPAFDLAMAMPTGTACVLRPGGRVLVLLPGAGLEAALHLACGAATVDLPVDEPLLTELLGGPYGQATNRLLQHPRLHLLEAASRTALVQSPRRYDLVHFALSDPFRPVASGAFSLGETYGLTLEAVGTAFARMDNGGILILDRWLTTPPAESLRAWATVVETVRRSGRDPARHVIAFRTLRTSTIAAAEQPWNGRELDQVRQVLLENGWDPIYLPDLQPDEVNRHLRVPANPYPALFRDLLETPTAAIAANAFRIEPVTDDRPFFFHFFRWRQTPDALAALGQTWQPFGGSGYLVLIGLLGLVGLLSAVILAAPTLAGAQPLSWPGRAYFAGIGAGFLMIEIALVQRFTLPLEQPAIAFVVVVGGLLVASGVGSRISERWPLEWSPLGVAALTLLQMVALPAAIQAFLGWSFVARIAVSLALLAPLGLLMGVPFPAGLRRYAAGERGAVGSAWAVNGAASAVAGVVATLIALDLGLTAVLGLGGLAYLGAWAAARR